MGLVWPGMAALGRWRSACSYRAGIFAAIWLCWSSSLRAQELEPRAYSPAPIGTNFLVSNYTRSTGSESTDPSLPISGVQATIDTAALGYSRIFGLFGQTASLAIALPYLHGKISGVVGEQGTQVTRSGVGDLRLRFAQSLAGGPALPPDAFARREPTTSVGTSITILAPTGDYNPAHIVNVGGNRWGFKPEIGIAQPIGSWFADAAAGTWLFTDNRDFSNGHLRSQGPLWSIQVHGGYYFRPGFWLAADAIHYEGGGTSIDGVGKHDSQSVTRYGVTLSMPLSEAISAKLSWANWLAAHNGGRFDSIGLTLQYRWFNN